MRIVEMRIVDLRIDANWTKEAFDAAVDARLGHNRCAATLTPQNGGLVLLSSTKLTYG
jgi:hypothetical protein